MKRATAIRSARAGRIALFSIATMLLAAFAFASAVGEVFVRTNPVLTSKIGIGNRAQAKLNYTLLLAAAGEPGQNNAELIDAAKDALAVQPLNPKALVSIATSQFQANNAEKSLLFARLAEKVSRREFGAHIILFQNALLKNDLPGAFAQLDIAMRTAGERRTMLFPVITRGLQIAEFRDGLVPVIDQRRDWSRQFLIYAVDEGGAAVEVAELFRALEPRTRIYLTPMLAQRTITRLTDGNHVREARAMFAAIPGKDAAILSDPGLNEATFDLEIGSLGWRLEEGPTLTARVVKGDSPRTRAALIDVGPGNTSPALTRIVFMPPGSYTFSARTRTDGGDGDVASQWVIRCHGDPQSSLNWTSGRGSRVTIPADCPAQMIQLIVKQNNASSYGQLLVESVSLRRV